MPWVKRNLYFLVGSAVALVLLGLSGYYCYSKWQLNTDNQDKLQAAYSEWNTLSTKSPGPGNDRINNIQLAKEQEQHVQSVIADVRKHFVPIAPIPNPTNNVVTSADFAAALRQTVDQLTRRANKASVKLPPNYDFSFEAQFQVVRFATGSLEPLSVQLGDVRAICNVLFNAKINALDGIRRERVSMDDQGGTQANYLPPELTSTTNDLAILRPYEVAFRCFSAELADTLAGFANQPHGFIVKVVNVEPAGTEDTNLMYGGEGYPQSYPPEYQRPGALQTYGGGGPYGRRGGYMPHTVYQNRRAMPTPTPGMYPGYQPAANPHGGLPTVLDESQIKVTIVLEIANLLPKK